MRVTKTILYDTFINDILRRQEDLLRTSRKLATGKEINDPSDDPVKADRILSSKSMLTSLEQYTRNAESSFSYLGMAEDALSSAKNVISRLQELTVTMATGTVDAGARSNAAVEVQNLYNQLLDIANTKLNDDYIFSGYKTDTITFDSVGTYGGDTNKYSVQVSPNSTVSIGLNGGEIFAGVGGGTDIFAGIESLITALNADDTTNIQAAVSTLDLSFSQISNSVSDIGGKVGRIQAINSNLEKLAHRTRVTISGLEDADLAKIISELQIGQVALEAALSSAGKVFNVNIFNYI
jgi:flagellar hook-associated protein 3 FlgL